MSFSPCYSVSSKSMLCAYLSYPVTRLILHSKVSLFPTPEFHTSIVERNCSVGKYENYESMIHNLLKCLKEFVSQGHLSKAFKTFSMIRFHASSTDSHYFILSSINSLLSSCIDLKALQEGQQLHAQIISSGLEPNSLLLPKLITLYSTFNLVYEVQTVTKNSNLLHPLHWNMLIAFYVKNKLFDEALTSYKQMLSSGIRPDNFTYPCILKACGEKLDFAFGREVHESINGYKSDLYVHNALISMYGKFSEVEIARGLFDNMSERDTISWNTIISCYASKGMLDEALELFEEMSISGLEADIVTWNTMLGGCLYQRNFKGALYAISLMKTRGLGLNSVSMIHGLGACSHIGAVNFGKEIHSSAIRGFCGGLENVKIALINMYSRCGDLSYAYTLFRLIGKSVITWTSMLSGYAYLDRSEEAFHLFREMLLSGVEPNQITLASMVPLCARVENLKYGKEFHCYILKCDIFKNSILIWNSLIDMYAKLGQVVAANDLFDLMSVRDKVTYTSLIAGYGMQRQGTSALDLFEEMIRFGIQPDPITMVVVLSACSHSGFVKEGQNLFREMERNYGIIPQIEHISCMVGLYGRAGLFKEVIEIMPCQPNEAMWATILKAACVHGNMDVGERAAEKLMDMKPVNYGSYVWMARLYKAAGCWYKLEKVRTILGDFEVKKASVSCGLI